MGRPSESSEQRMSTTTATPTGHAATPAAAEPSGLVMITVLLRHDQSNDLEAIQGRMKAKDWWERFPPEGVRIVSWTVAMGFGQIVTLEMPPHLLPVVNVELERSAWGVFRTECFPTYDFEPVRERIRERVRNGGQ
jgi:hypothetical protein